MSPSRKRNFYLVLGVILLSSVAELLTISAMIPFLAVISEAQDIPLGGNLSGLSEVFRAISPGSPILVATILLIVAAIVSAITRTLLTWTTLKFVLNLSHEIGQEIFSRMLRQPYSYYASRHSSEMVGGMEKVQTVVWGVLMPGMQGITAAFMALAIIILLFSIDPTTASVAAATISLTYLSVSLVVRRRLASNSARLAYAATERVKSIQEGLGGIRDILLEQSHGIFEAKFAKLDLDYRRSQAVNNFISLSPRFVVEAAGIIVVALIAFYLSQGPGGILAAIPVLGAMALGAQRLLPLLQQSYTGWSSFTGNSAMVVDVANLLQAPVVSTISRDPNRTVEPFRSEIQMIDVSFRYGPEILTLETVNIAIPKGARVGIVGKTGSGKSTLLDILMGLLDPTSGSITVDGIAIDDANRARWQSQIAHVPQSIFLTDSSIASNIAFGEDESRIDIARIKRAAKLAHIDDHIRSLPNGYSTLVGERGIRLSGGQRQRIGIARALYKSAPVLVLDEATSALDDSTEKEIMKSIEATGKEITIFMVAHRTSTLEGCDQIIELRDGRVIKSGSFTKMIGRG